MKRAVFASVVLAMAAPVSAAPIEVADLLGFLHVKGSLVEVLDRTSTTYSSTLNAQNLGSVGWTLTNTTATSWEDVVFLAFLDADIDRMDNTASNEIGSLVGLSAPPGAPAGAIAPSAWEIDEPGFLFGDVFTNLLAGTLDGTNAVNAASPDDVSLALGFALGTLAPGSTATITLMISLENLGGLLHRDPDSDYQFSFNGYATTRPNDTNPPPLPEPSSLVLLSIGSAAAAVARRRRRF